MQAYDPKNGQIYTETTASSTRSMVNRWKYFSRGRTVDPARYKHDGMGAASLKEMAMRTCAWNKHLFMPEALQWAGRHYAEMIYRYLKERDALSFEAWNILRQAVDEGVDMSEKFNMWSQHIHSDWDSIIATLSKIGESRVVTIFGAWELSLDLRQLMSLMQIPSLQSLALVACEGIQERQIRNWCRAASEKGALGNLTAIWLGVPTSTNIAQVHNLLDHLSALPALTTVGFRCMAKWRDEFEISEVKMHGQWERGFEKPCESHFELRTNTLSHLANGLHSKICSVSSKEEMVYSGRHRLSISCFGENKRLNKGSTIWYVRKELAQESSCKRPGEIDETTACREGKAVKKRKVRQSKQQDVGALLGELS